MTQNNQAIFEQQLREARRDGVDELIAAIRKTDFYSARCGGHDKDAGGTLRHSLWVYSAAKKILAKDANKYPGIAADSLALVCLLHDLGDITRGVRHRSGHGSKAARILVDIMKISPFYLSDEELSAIRFHRKKVIKNQADKILAAYWDSPLIKLLKRADWIAASVLNYIPYETPLRPLLCTKEKFDIDVRFDPTRKICYYFTKENLTYTANQLDPKSFPIIKGTTHVFGCCLFNFWFYDLLILKDNENKLGLFLRVEGDDMGKMFKTDRGAFCRKRVILYYNLYACNAASHFVLMENTSGKWLIIRLLGNLDNKYLVTSASSEKDAISTLRHLNRNSIDLSNKDYFQRIPVTVR